MIRRESTWTQATVTAKLQEPKSYLVKTPQGQIFRRNRRHLGRGPDQQIPGPSDVSTGTDIRQPETHTNTPSPPNVETPTVTEGRMRDSQEGIKRRVIQTDDIQPCR